MFAAVACISAVMEPRGPDGHGLWHEGPVALAHRRLAIIDLSETGAQPMVDAELRSGDRLQRLHLQLQAAARGTAGLRVPVLLTSDTEVIAKAYHRWGVHCVDHFFGMFAFAILEQDTGRLILGRDRLGIKPMYLSHTAEPVALRLVAARAARRRETSTPRSTRSH